MTTNQPDEKRPAEPTLEPPEPTDLTLEPPQPVTTVAPSAASTMVPLDQSALPGLEKMVQDYVESIVRLDARSPEFAKKAESVRTMGDADIRAAAAVSNRMLERPVRAAPGDVVRVTCRHDASLRTGEPRYVLWGEGTADEMCLGVLQVTRG